LDEGSITIGKPTQTEDTFAPTKTFHQQLAASFTQVNTDPSCYVGAHAVVGMG
jgi:hypothetical protein